MTISVRSHVWRGRVGWLICGKPRPDSAWPVSIFHDGTQNEARWIAQAVREDRPWTFAEAKENATKETV